jgi:hypothetical protein
MDANPHLATAGLKVHDRTFCRNPHCGAKLKTPTADPRSAFCCLGCYRIFYRGRCLICEKPCSAKAQTCSRTCRSELRRNRAKYPSRYYPTGERRADTKSARGMGAKMAPAGDRAWRVVAGPTPPEASLLVPLDPETAARVRRAYERAWAAGSQVKPGDWPVNLVGGDYRGRPLDPGLARTIIETECPERRTPMAKTARQLNNQARKLDRRQQQINRFIGRMQARGCALQIYYTFGRPIFTLSDGVRIPETVGYELTKHPRLVAVDPPLVAGCLPQTFRYVDEPRR